MVNFILNGFLVIYRRIVVYFLSPKLIELFLVNSEWSRIVFDIDVHQKRFSFTTPINNESVNYLKNWFHIHANFYHKRSNLIEEISLQGKSIFSLEKKEWKFIFQWTLPLVLLLNKFSRFSRIILWKLQIDFQKDLLELFSLIFELDLLICFWGRLQMTSTENWIFLNLFLDISSQ